MMLFMKILLLFFFTISTAFGLSIVPDRIVTPSLNLFSTSNKVLENGDVEVSVTTYNKRGKFIRYGGKKVLKKEEYERFLKPSLAVFEMIPGLILGEKDKDTRRGTAFHIGHNLVLTNHHVLDKNFSNFTQCADFEIKDHKGETYKCKKVHYCNAEHDICLIEMMIKHKTKRQCWYCRGTKYEVSLAQGPLLKIKKSYEPTWEETNNAILTAIGNSEGYGIHFSQGKGVTVGRDRIYFYAPITEGNSGGALLNEAGLVIGVVKLQSHVLIHDDPNKAYNVAAPSNLVISLINEALQHDPSTLEKFNSAVVE